MNKDTKIRTILVAATCLNTALMATDVAQFHNETVNLIYRVLSVILNFVVVACATYYNNDFTEEGEIGTLLTRQLKEEASCKICDEDEYEESEEIEESEV